MRRSGAPLAEPRSSAPRPRYDPAYETAHRHASAWSWQSCHPWASPILMLLQALLAPLIVADAAKCSSSAQPDVPQVEARQSPDTR